MQRRSALPHRLGFQFTRLKPQFLSLNPLTSNLRLDSARLSPLFDSLKAHFAILIPHSRGLSHLSHHLTPDSIPLHRQTTIRRPCPVLTERGFPSHSTFQPPVSPA